MLRAGVDPKWVNRFMSQPIIKELVAQDESDKSKINKHYLDEQNAIEGKMVFVRDGEVIVKEVAYGHNESTLERVLKKHLGDNWGNMVDTVSANEVNSMDIAQLESELIGPTSDNQIAMIKKFLFLKNQADVLNDVVLATKRDTDGPTNSLIEADRIGRKVEELKADPRLINFDKLVAEDTMLGSFDEYSRSAALDQLSGLLVSGAPITRNTVNATMDQMGMLNIDKNRQLVLKHFKTYLASGASAFDLDVTKRKDLISKTPTTLKAFKKEFPKSPLGKIITMKVEKIPELNEGHPIVIDGQPQFSSFSYIGTVSSKKDSVDRNRIWTEWESMKDDHAEFGGTTVAQFAEDLISYSFMNSGLDLGQNSFSEFIPHTALQGHYNQMKYSLGMLNNGEGVYNNFITQFARHNLELAPVKRIEEGDSVLKNASGVEIGVQMQNDKTPDIFKRSKKAKVIYVFDKMIEVDGEWMKQYQAHRPLGVESNVRTSYEYNRYENPESSYRKSLPLIDSSNLENETETNKDKVNVTIKDENGVLSIENVNDSKIEIVEFNEVIDDERVALHKMTINGVTLTSEAFETREEALEAGVNALNDRGLDKVKLMIENKC